MVNIASLQMEQNLIMISGKKNMKDVEME